jgi:hypothetical protein
VHGLRDLAQAVRRIPPWASFSSERGVACPLPCPQKNWIDRRPPPAARSLVSTLQAGREMKSSAHDGTKQRRRGRPSPRSGTPRSAGWTGCVLLWALGGACTEQTPTRASPTTFAQTVAGGGSAASATAHSTEAEAIRERTTHGQMLSHYGDTATMRKALVAGKLAEYQVAAAALARDEWSPTPTTADAPAFVQRMGAAAAAAEGAPSLASAAAALSALADVCASCHVASDVRKYPLAPEEPSEAKNPHMLDHAIASDRLWAGLVLPSDESWVSGTRLLAQVATLDAPSVEVSAAAHRLSELARRGEVAAVEQRAQIFGDVMLTCSGCHERLGVVPAGAEIER